jgi:hypothetical protein
MTVRQLLSRQEYAMSADVETGHALPVLSRDHLNYELDGDTRAPPLLYGMPLDHHLSAARLYRVSRDLWRAKKEKEPNSTPQLRPELGTT